MTFDPRKKVEDVLAFHIITGLLYQYQQQKRENAGTAHVVESTPSANTETKTDNDHITAANMELDSVNSCDAVVSNSSRQRHYMEKRSDKRTTQKDSREKERRAELRFDMDSLMRKSRPAVIAKTHTHTDATESNGGIESVPDDDGHNDYDGGNDPTLPLDAKQAAAPDDSTENTADANQQLERHAKKQRYGTASRPYERRMERKEGSDQKKSADNNIKSNRVTCRLCGNSYAASYYRQHVERHQETNDFRPRPNVKAMQIQFNDSDLNEHDFKPPHESTQLPPMNGD